MNALSTLEEAEISINSAYLARLILIFNTLGKFIAGKYKIIVPIWIVALILLSPLIINASHYVSLQQTSTTNISSESQLAQSILDKQFKGSSTDSLVVVLSSDNVTKQEIKDFVLSLTKYVSQDKNLTGFVSSGNVYSSSSKLINSTVNAEVKVKNATGTFLNLFFGVPSEFLGVWVQKYGMNISMISQAQQDTNNLLSNQIKNSTELFIAERYLSAFISSFTSSNSSISQREDYAVRKASSSIIELFPNGIRQFAQDVVNHFTFENFTSPKSIGSFVVYETAKTTLFSERMCSYVYSLVNGSSSYNKILNLMINNPDKFGLPQIYRNTVEGYLSNDHSVMLVTFSFKNVTDSIVSEVRKDVSHIYSSYGMNFSVYVTGQDALRHDIVTSDLHDADIILPVTIALLLIATGIYFRSLLTPFVSLGTIGIALGISQVMIILIALYVAGVDATTPTILLTVLMGVGTDYSIFLLARYREERVRGSDPKTSVITSVTWAGESITTSGLTVIVSFAFLGLQPVTYLKSLGLVVGLGVLIALLASLTLIPSIVMLMPSFVFFPNTGERFKLYAHRVIHSLENRLGYFSKSGDFAIKHAKAISVIALVATLPSMYVWSTVVPSYDFLSAAPKNVEAVSGFNILTSSFGSGSLFPTYVVINFSEPIYTNTTINIKELNLVDQISNITLSNSIVKSVTGPTRPGGARIHYGNLGTDPRSELLVQNILSNLGKDTHYALLKVDMKESPYTQDSLNFISQLRNALKKFQMDNSGEIKSILVGGAAASTLDTSFVVNNEFYQVIGYVTLVVAVILLFVLGSLFLPVFAVASVVMSITWTIAVTKIVFSEIYNAPILYITPLTLFVLLLGLGMDYNIFILTRIREEAFKGKKLENAIISAIENTGGIITAAAIILAGSLGALMLSSGLLLKEFGFAFFFSILIDAMVTRTYIVPAVMSILGKWNWYAPGKLQRVRLRTDEEK
jgi:RND superfamily putative drug exporter